MEWTYFEVPCKPSRVITMTNLYDSEPCLNSRVIYDLLTYFPISIYPVLSLRNRNPRSHDFRNRNTSLYCPPRVIQPDHQGFEIEGIGETTVSPSSSSMVGNYELSRNNLCSGIYTDLLTLLKSLTNHPKFRIFLQRTSIDPSNPSSLFFIVISLTIL